MKIQVSVDFVIFLNPLNYESKGHLKFTVLHQIISVNTENHKKVPRKNRSQTSKGTFGILHLDFNRTPEGLHRKEQELP